jgi:hypothetical protein
MNGRTRRVTANLPADLLEQALETTGERITETLTQGLRLSHRTRAYPKAMKLKGKLHLRVDRATSRERRRR